MNLQQWLVRYQNELSNDWERMLVDQVLSKVKDLDWQSVSAQMPFKDRDGRRRYADFAFSEGEHVRIVIEVDGYDKRGRGSGMTHDEFVDWQRRQNALSDQGWSVLRFANRDVRDYPKRCAEHVTLLLRKQRHQMAHHEELHRSILQMESQLKQALSRVAETEQHYGNALEDERKQIQAAKRAQSSLEKELQRARREMALAEQAPELDQEQSARLADLNRAQEEELELLRLQVQEQEARIVEGEGEQDKMKTAIWAFAVVVIAAMGMLVYVSSDRSTSATSSISEPTTVVATPGASCDDPIDWRDAREFVGRSAAVRGQVVAVNYRPQTSGQPTWINVGADFPDRNRFVAVVWGRNRSALARTLDDLRTGDWVCVFGEVSEYQGVSQIEVESSAQIRKL